MIIEIPYIFLQAVLFSAITYPTINFPWTLYKGFWYVYAMFCTLLYFSYFGILLAALTPTFQVAMVLASFCYTMFNLFSGFLVPGPVSQLNLYLLDKKHNCIYSLESWQFWPLLQKIPKWWVWGYWICPVAWSLNGLLTSQYGDLNREIVVHGEEQTISAFLESIHGYYYDELKYVAIVLFAFPLVFAFAFGVATEKLNFQRR